MKKIILIGNVACGKTTICQYLNHMEIKYKKTQALEAYQSEPESEENLEKIPVLKREDISREIEPIINEEMTLAGDVPWLKHSVKTFILNLLFKKNNSCYHQS